ncbi:hypothetical protein CEXT_511191 [Caerostris extrusa]|uniref:Uncharacterized protein n=1 Tax=Caerostris extrusa TaxID=172846 RepID=A0AAV4TPA3_CAEEX|nr:hypothetical protein CEXT_511191 [Caerostris extrusa]
MEGVEGSIPSRRCQREKVNYAGGWASSFLSLDAPFCCVLADFFVRTRPRLFSLFLVAKWRTPRVFRALFWLEPAAARDTDYCNPFYVWFEMVLQMESELNRFDRK